MDIERYHKNIEPASGAIIMANGIFLMGAVEAFPLLDILLGKYLAFILLIVWMVIYIKLSIQFFRRDFLIPYLRHPVDSFTIGTWIAGVSVLCNVLLRYFPEILIMTQAIALLNTVLWLFFLVNCFHNFKRLIGKELEYGVHGVVLLSTVGTQSIIILLNNAFFQFPSYFIIGIIVLGLLFYILGIIQMIKGYLIRQNWTLADNWANTNCIIHGALSITGLAIVTTGMFTSLSISIFWLVVFLLVILIESTEVVRAISRIRLYGWNEGIFHYHITQWSRNFTFGMFYAFTIVFHNHMAYSIPNSLYTFQVGVLSIWAWVVLVALIIQIILYVKASIEKVTQYEV